MVWASFNALIPQLHLLSIMGLGYQLSLDFSKPLPLTEVAQLICVGDVGTFLRMDFELMPLQDKPSEKVSYACLD
jgi:hypothetical protein